VSVAAVIPTRARLGGLQAAVASLRAQERRPDAILVVDNESTDGTAAWLAEQEDVTVLPLHANTGAPGGFQAGIDAALAAGHEWIWLIDDDCVAEPAALAALLRVADGHGRIGGIVPTVRFGDDREETGRRVGEAALMAPTTGEDADWAPFAGLLLAAEACRAAGPLRTDWFLWHADVEYCLRLRLAGWRLPVAPQARVWHPTPPEHVRRLGPREVRVADFAPWREYYDTRNLVALRRLTAGTPLHDPRPPWRRAAGELARAAAVLIADPRGLRRIVMRGVGAVDGLRGRWNRHPERDPRWA
jgi:rhamnopyranosyl-N-acetylglucosaminyl-diphospho-decaprenol beta-1,3/1,4-galactofuranosyltransferase